MIEQKLVLLMQWASRMDGEYPKHLYEVWMEVAQLPFELISGKLLFSSFFKKKFIPFFFSVLVGRSLLMYTNCILESTENRKQRPHGAQMKGPNYT